MDPAMREALRKAHDHIMSMSDEELEAELAAFEKNMPTCSPKTCHGECQGLGTCKLCQQFQMEEFGTTDIGALWFCKPVNDT